MAYLILFGEGWARSDSLSPTLIAGAIFFVTYALIVSERVHRTVSALSGGLCMVPGGVLSQKEAFHAVDWNVIFLLLGMMAITAILRETGLFRWVAVQAVRLGNGRPYRILAILALITALSSAFLDNVTIVVLVVPITLFVAANLHMDPLPFLISEVLASNIGGTAALIGDPPNVLIASAADIDFLTFLVHNSLWSDHDHNVFGAFQLLCLVALPVTKKLEVQIRCVLLSSR